jgi:uncharacterized protein with HEPN domain
MLSKSQAALIDIRENILLAQKIVEGNDYQAFEASRVLFYAATRCLEIISEASRRLPEDMRMRHSALPWRDIMDAGNFYRHQYGNVSEKFVWRTINESLAPLLAMVSAEMGPSSE